LVINGVLKNWWVAKLAGLLGNMKIFEK